MHARARCPNATTHARVGGRVGYGSRLEPTACWQVAVQVAVDLNKEAGGANGGGGGWGGEARGMRES